MAPNVPNIPSVDRALLLASLPSLSPHFLAPVIARAAQTTRKHLIIVLFCSLFDTHGGISHVDHWDDVQRLLTFVYVQATRVVQAMDNVLMQVDVLLKGSGDDDLPSDFGTAFEAVYRVSGGNAGPYTDPSVH